MTVAQIIGRGILAWEQRKAERIESEWYAGAIAEYVERCIVCGGRDPVRLSSGLTVHPKCWPKVTWGHIRRQR